MKIIHKYILKETIAPFLLALFVVTFILLFVKIDRIADNVINKGVPLTTVFIVLGNMALYLFRITIPIAFMTAILLSLGRMSSENELLALRSLGISLHRLLTPVVILAVILSFIMLYMQDRVFPNIEHKIERVFYSLAAKSEKFAVKEREFIEMGDYTFFIQRIKGNKIEDITIYEPVGNKTHRTVTAKEGLYQIIEEDNRIVFDLEQGTFDEPKSPESKTFYKMRFDNYVVNIPLDDMSAGPISKSITEMTFGELLSKAELIRGDLKKKDLKREFYKIYNEFYKRITFSFAVLVLSLLSIPVSITVHRSEKSINFALAMGIVVLYYILLGFGEAITLKGFIFPILTTSLPNIVLGTLGVVLYVKLVKS